MSLTPSPFSRVIFYLTFSFLFLFLMPIYVDAQTEDAQTAYDEAIALYQEGNLEGSLESLNRAIELSPEWAQSYYARGRVYDVLGEYESAIEDYSNTIELDPEGPFPYYYRAILYNRLNEYDLAIEDLNTYLEFRPDDIDGLVSRALAFAYSENCDSAEADTTRIMQLTDNDSGGFVAFSRVRANEACSIGLEPKYSPGMWSVVPSAPVADCRGSSFTFLSDVSRFEGELISLVGFPSSVISGPVVLNENTFGFSLRSSITPDNGVTFTRTAEVTLVINSPTSVTSTYVVSWDISQGTNCPPQTVIVNFEYLGEDMSDVCLITASQSVNLRSGPGTTFAQAGQLANAEIAAIGQTTASDGFVWWQLVGGNWVRADIVQAGENCDTLPEVG